MIQVIIGGAGTGKSTRLIEKLRQSVLAGERVVSLVPEQFSYEFDQKLYHALGASLFNQMETYSFKSLARAVFQQYGMLDTDKTYADELTKTALLYQALSELTQQHLLQFYEKQCQQVAFVEELSAVLAQMRQNGITAQQLYETSGTVTGRLQAKLLDLSYIYQTYDRLLAVQKKKDTESDITEAAAVANGQDAFVGDCVFIDEFDIFTEDEYEMLSVLFSGCKEITIALCMDNLEQTPFSMFASVQETYYRICQMARQLHISVELVNCTAETRFRAPDLQWLSDHVFRDGTSYGAQAQHIHLFAAETPNEEIDYVCATIRRLLAADTTLRCRDIAVLTNQMTDYQSILETVMERYGIPYHMNAKNPMLYTPLLIYVHTLVELLSARQPETEWLLRLGKTGLTTCTSQEIAELENYCYTWRVEGKTWRKPFSGGNWDAVEPIRQKLWGSIEIYQKKWRVKQKGISFCHILYAYLVQEQVEQRLGRQLLEITDESQRMQTQQAWTFVWNALMDVLDHLAELYAQFEMDAAMFRNILFAMMRTIQRAIPPRTLDAVLLSQGNTARFNATKIVFLVGVCEGSFPSQPKGSALFSQRDCLELEKHKLLFRTRKEVQMTDFRLAAYKQIAAASQMLYMTYPQVDIAHQKCYPAAVIEQIREMFSDTPQLLMHRESLGPAYYAGTMRAAYFQFVQNYAAKSPQMQSIFTVLSEDPLYRSRMQSLLTQLQRENQDDVVAHYQIQDPQLVGSYLGDTLYLSASSLERYALCPFSYFCRDILHLFSRSRVEMAGAGSGNLIHYCLEQLLKTYDKDAFVSLSKEKLTDAVMAYSKQYWEVEMGGDFSKRGRDLALYRRTVAWMMPMLVHMQQELRQSAFVPYQMELKITPDNPDFPAIRFQTPDGKTLIFSGKVDRVDLCTSEEKVWVRVVDYKSGTKTFSLGNLLYGLDMQMLLYLFAITSPGTLLSHANPAGVLYLPSGKVKCDLKRGEQVTPEQHQHDTYRMNGVLLRDAKLLTLMEEKGEGIYISGKLDANHQIDDRTGTFVSEKQMQLLKDYTRRMLVQMGENVYAGVIDATPLVMQMYDPCSYCIYQNICGNLTQQHCRTDGRTQKQREKKLMETLEELAKELDGKAGS